MSAHGIWLPLGVSLVLGLIWTSTALGDGSLFAPAVNHAAGDAPISVANQGSDNVSVLLKPGRQAQTH